MPIDTESSTPEYGEDWVAVRTDTFHLPGSDTAHVPILPYLQYDAAVIDICKSHNKAKNRTRLTKLQKLIELSKDHTMLTTLKDLEKCPEPTFFGRLIGRSFDYYSKNSQYLPEAFDQFVDIKCNDSLELKADGLVYALTGLHERHVSIGGPKDPIVKDPTFNEALHLQKGIGGGTGEHTAYVCFASCGQQVVSYVGRTSNMEKRFLSNTSLTEPYPSHAASVMLARKYGFAHMFCDTVFAILGGCVYVVSIKPSDAFKKNVRSAIYSLVEYGTKLGTYYYSRLAHFIAGPTQSESLSARSTERLAQLAEKRFESFIITMIEYYLIGRFSGLPTLNEVLKPMSLKKTIYLADASKEVDEFEADFESYVNEVIYRCDMEEFSKAQYSFTISENQARPIHTKKGIVRHANKVY